MASDGLGIGQAIFNWSMRALNPRKASQMTKKNVPGPITTRPAQVEIKKGEGISSSGPLKPLGNPSQSGAGGPAPQPQAPAPGPAKGKQ